MDKEPTEAQKKAGNYKKEHKFLHGMRLSIENKAGSTRKGVDPDGKPWESEMAHDYGYIRYTTGKDKDHIDAFLGPEPDKDHPVFVIDQNDRDGKFDEHKVMLGFPDENSAYTAYHDNYPPGHDGFDAINRMDMADFKKWAYSGKSGKRKPVSELMAFKKGGSVPDCGCGGHKPAYAEGGAVTEEELAEAARPFVGYRGRRAEANNDRIGAQEVPLQALRGAVTGSLGFGGDIEKLGRTLANWAGADVEETPVLPTSDFYSDILPGAPKSAAGKAASGAGTALGMPLTGVGLGAIRAGKAAAPVVRGALEQVARNAAAPTRLSKQAGAVKMPGGNWMPGSIENTADDLVGDAYDANVKKWLDKRVSKYIRNEMGTPADPLLKLEAEGKMHLTPEDLIARADEQGLMHRFGNMVGHNDPHAPPVYNPVDPIFHEKATGRKTATAWENLTDPAVRTDSMGEMVKNLDRNGERLGVDGAPGWMKNLGEDVDIHSVDKRDFSKLGFDHVRDYLEQATAAGNVRQAWAANPATREMGGQDMARSLIERNLDIDPSKLGTMSLPDVIRKTSDWNNFIYKAKELEDMNKGIKEVIKAYPDSGHQWVELAPEGLEAEGKAMRHCVGGYCDSVSAGSKRIMSLRDSKGQPAVTIELAKTPLNYHYLSDKDFIAKVGQEKAQEFKNAVANRGQNKNIIQVEQEVFKDEIAAQPWDVAQIKGPANRAPSKEVQSMVQDFIKTQGKWGEIRDIENAGLVNFNESELPDYIRGHVQKQYGLKALPQKGFYTPEEFKSALEAANPDLEIDPTVYQNLGVKGVTPRYATGGAVNVPDPNGYFTPKNPDGTPVATAPGMSTDNLFAGQSLANARGLVAPTLSAKGLTNWDPNPNAGAFASLGSASTNNLKTIGGNDFYVAPETRDYGNTEDPILSAQLHDKTYGRADSGVSAFLGGDYRFNKWNGQYGGDGQDPVIDTGFNVDPLVDLAKKVGFDSSKYDLNADPYAGGTGDMSPEAQSRSVQAFYADLDHQLKDYTSIQGLADWTGTGKKMQAAKTMYKRQGDQLVPVSAPQEYIQRKGGAWNNMVDTGFISALSMLMPVFGGFAGVAGAGSAGTVTAGGGLGLTTGLSGAIGSTATNALVNAAAAGALGGGYQGALASLAGSAGGAAGSSLAGGIGSYLPNIGGLSQAGQMLGSQAGKALYNSTRKT